MERFWPGMNLYLSVSFYVLLQSLGFSLRVQSSMGHLQCSFSFLSCFLSFYWRSLHILVLYLCYSNLLTTLKSLYIMWLLMNQYNLFWTISSAVQIVIPWWKLWWLVSTSGPVTHFRIFFSY